MNNSSSSIILPGEIYKIVKIYDDVRRISLWKDAKYLNHTGVILTEEDIIITLSFPEINNNWTDIKVLYKNIVGFIWYKNSRRRIKLQKLS